MRYRAIGTNHYIASDGYTGEHYGFGPDKYIVADGNSADFCIIQKVLGACIVAENMDTGCHGNIITDFNEPTMAGI